jgi:hypothetical protein
MTNFFRNLVRGRPTGVKITKPIEAMSIEELLEALPTMSDELVAEVWLPQLKQKVIELQEANADEGSHALDELNQVSRGRH